MRTAALIAALVVPLALVSGPGAALADEVPAASAAPVPAGAYTVDKAHTSLIFRVSHLGFSTYTGRFTRLDARLQFDPANLATSRVDVRVPSRPTMRPRASCRRWPARAGSMRIDSPT